MPDQVSGSSNVSAGAELGADRGAEPDLPLPLLDPLPQHRGLAQHRLVDVLVYQYTTNNGIGSLNVFDKARCNLFAFARNSDISPNNTLNMKNLIFFKIIKWYSEFILAPRKETIREIRLFLAVSVANFTNLKSSKKFKSTFLSKDLDRFFLFETSFQLLSGQASS